MSNGLIDKAFLSGTSDPALFYKKYPAILRTPKGGYEIQATPQEVAAVITQSRAWVKGHHMLCVGSDTLGAERFIAENLGMMDIEYIGNALDHNAVELKAKNVKKPTGVYDVVTVFGNAKVTAILPFTKIGSLIVFIGIGANSKNQELRQSWLDIRRKHMTMLQTGGEPWQMGVGVVKMLFVPNQDVEPEVKDGKKTVYKQEGRLSIKDVADNAKQPSVPKPITGGNSQSDTPKRRGRAPGSKNKVKA